MKLNKIGGKMLLMFILSLGSAIKSWTIFGFSFSIAKWIGYLALINYFEIEFKWFI